MGGQRRREKKAPIESWPGFELWYLRCAWKGVPARLRGERPVDRAGEVGGECYQMTSNTGNALVSCRTLGSLGFNFINYCLYHL